MNPFSYIRYKFKEFVFWLKRKIQGDVRPQAVKPQKPKRKPRKKKENA